jgi:hypothetical protein
MGNGGCVLVHDRLFRPGTHTAGKSMWLAGGLTNGAGKAKPCRPNHVQSYSSAKLAVVSAVALKPHPGADISRGAAQDVRTHVR